MDKCAASTPFPADKESSPQPGDAAPLYDSVANSGDVKALSPPCDVTALHSDHASSEQSTEGHQDSASQTGDRETLSPAFDNTALHPDNAAFD